MKRICLLGSTGSIGVSTLDVVRQHPERYSVHSFVAGRNVERLAEQIVEFKPRYVAVADDAVLQSLHELGPWEGVECLAGQAAAAELAAHDDADIVLAAIVGAAGLLPTYAAVQAGKIVALANKEAMVVAGPLMQKAVAASGATILPVDSEHSAVFQSLHGHRDVDVHKIILTASGGPFRDLPAESFAEITLEQALKHPNWAMGAKITIDSATMMNKGLELIEARWLFDCPPEQLDVLVHPESIVHALVEYVDGSVIAQLAAPDMRAPIAYALAFPERIPCGIPQLNLAQTGALHFREPDRERFPALRLAEQVNVRAGTAPTILNAANEVAVAAFLERRIHFTEIASTVDATLQTMEVESCESVEQVLAVDAKARLVTTAQLTQGSAA